MEVAIVSDSHVPSREQRVPEWVLDLVREADHTIHAGDFDSTAALETFEEEVRTLTAVLGNIDPDDLGLPHVATLDVEDVRFVITHGTGPAENYRKRVADIVAENTTGDRVTVGVSGHTHQPMDEMVEGYRLLNPGSCTGARPAAGTTAMSVTVDGEAVSVRRLSE
jgi:hypothetical protein